MAPAITEIEAPPTDTIFTPKKDVSVSTTVPSLAVQAKASLAGAVPPSKWTPMCHPRMAEVAREVDGDFIRDWGFPDAKSRQKFLDAGFSRVTCLYFPAAKDDRIHWACRLLTILFLIDDILEEMSFEDGERYNDRLMPIMRGDVLPDRTKPAEWIMYDMWEGMRACDRKLADDVLEPTFTFMRAQTDRNRSVMRNLGQYLEYREKDVGKALLSTLMCFSMGFDLTPVEKQLVRSLERNCAKQISVVNDICSWEKEVIASKSGHVEGSVLCSAVRILADETDLTIGSTKRLLWAMAREWSDHHDRLAARLEAAGCSENVRRYNKGLEYQMSGNEEWSLSTLRYLDVELDDTFEI
ncbi:Aristolochene synthase [Elsinoe australis]|uniref:Terpene synthase n=1 Tax=Elsinoe australis TaxID=40998 RepID=A0A2P7YDD5_9PEZI|nr:Aristolochene synthase [Elsinoe australis]